MIVDPTPYPAHKAPFKRAYPTPNGWVSNEPRKDDHLKLQAGEKDVGRNTKDTSAVSIPGMTDRRFVGTIKSRKDNKFGFIVCEELAAEQDIFVHYTQLKHFQVGDEVSFQLIVNEAGGFKAVEL